MLTFTEASSTIIVYTELDKVYYGGGLNKSIQLIIKYF